MSVTIPPAGGGSSDISQGTSRIEIWTCVKQPFLRSFPLTTPLPHWTVSRSRVREKVKTRVRACESGPLPTAF